MSATHAARTDLTAKNRLLLSPHGVIYSLRFTSIMTEHTRLSFPKYFIGTIVPANGELIFTL